MRGVAQTAARSKLAAGAAEQGLAAAAAALAERDYFVTNGMMVVQGPNYALAKTLQMWRCLVARDEGRTVSCNMAPGCRTDSVTHNGRVARALEGMAKFPPMMVFDGATVAPVMALLLLFDLASARAGDGRSTASPAVALDSPMQLFEQSAFHGGGWRCPYTVDSIGNASYLAGFVVKGN